MTGTESRILVYYETMPSDDSTGTFICTTEKSYFDKNGCVDDGGSGDIYRRVSEAMCTSGAPEASESVFETGLPVETVVGNMAMKGFDLIKDPTFSALVLGTD